MSLSTDLDSALDRPDVHKQRHELGRLAAMFSEHSLLEMRKAFNKTDTSGHSDYQVAFGWIDKRPYAELSGQGARVELGDLAIIALSRVTCRGKPPRNFSGRCALMQAKLQDLGVSNSLDVLFGKTDASSQNQLQLLSNWGCFDLFRHSVGGQKIGSFSLAPEQESHGWFMANHRDSTQASQEGAAWLCGPPNLGASCKSTIGEVIASVASFDPHLSIGHPCTLTPKLRGKSSDWDKLVALLIRECVREELPGVAQAVAGRGSRLAGIFQMMSVNAADDLLQNSAWLLSPRANAPWHSENGLRNNSGTPISMDPEGRMGVLGIVRTVTDRY